MTQGQQSKHNLRAMVHSIPKKVISKVAAFAKSTTSIVIVAVAFAVIVIVGQAHQRAKVDAHDAKYNIVTPNITIK